MHEGAAWSVICQGVWGNGPGLRQIVNSISVESAWLLRLIYGAEHGYGAHGVLEGYGRSGRGYAIRSDSYVSGFAPISDF